MDVRDNVLKMEARVNAMKPAVNMKIVLAKAGVAFSTWWTWKTMPKANPQLMKLDAIENVIASFERKLQIPNDPTSHP